MHPLAAWWRRRGLRRGLVLVLALAFALSGLFHVAGSEQGVFGATHSHELVAQGAGCDAHGGPCAADHNAEPHGLHFSAAGDCPYCAPLAPGTVAALPEAEPTATRPHATHFSRVLSPHRRPPKPLPNA